MIFSTGLKRSIIFILDIVLIEVVQWKFEKIVGIAVSNLFL